MAKYKYPCYTRKAPDGCAIVLLVLIAVGIARVIAAIII